ncbi:MAG: histidine--tRNA ligase [Nitrospinota bacterium]|nr:histidine--tRNA ligase [Nitrospinota bacterium]
MARQKLTAVRGVKDILPEEARRWSEAERVARDIFARYGYGEIRVPAFERTELFSRGIGEGTDIVTKEMYTFEDKGGDSITLRPEATASICRAYVQNSLYAQAGVAKLFCTGPMFRYERPQAGRYRQFHQIDAEALGTDDPALDAEVIFMLMEFLEAMGLSGLSLQLNNIGDAECRPVYAAALLEFLREETAGIGADGMGEGLAKRIERNPLRFLDSKDPAHAEIIARAPTIDQFWNERCRRHLGTLCRHLDRGGVRYERNTALVRGLDYYCLTVFEVTSENLGAQNAVCGGGRYDGLVEELGGPPTPAIGFAIGMERLLQLTEKADPGPGWDAREQPIEVFIVALGDSSEAESLTLASELRGRGLRTDRTFGGGSMKSQMKRADRSGARYVIVLGEEEISGGVVALREMAESRQEEIERAGIGDYLCARLRT